VTRAKGLDKHLRRMRALGGPEMVRAVGAAVYESADAIRAEAFRSISAGSVSGAGHVASKPGEAPNRDTGNLQSKLKTVPTGPISAEVRSEAAYAAPLEFGTSNMAARPYMRPARDKELHPSRKRLAQQLDRLSKRSG
jgi:HK97 gp10 family phage protein